MRCTVCSHQLIKDINADLLSGVTLKVVTAKYPPLKFDAIYRHSRNHLSRVPANWSDDAADLNLAEANLDETIVKMTREVNQLVSLAKRNKDERLYLQAFDRLIKLLSARTNATQATKNVNIDAINLDSLDDDQAAQLAARLVSRIKKVPVGLVQAAVQQYNDTGASPFGEILRLAKPDLANPRTLRIFP